MPGLNWPTPDRVDSALDWARARLAALPQAEPLDGAVLLAAVLGVERAALIAHPERALTAEQSAAFSALIERRAAGEPVAYILGERAFFDGMFNVNTAVLIPRPETEHLIEAALSWTRTRRGDRAARVLRAVDVGAGSGAIAVTLAAHLPQAEIWAVDVSAAALDVVRANAARAGVSGRVRPVRGDLLVPLIDVGVQVDLIIANLPYIPSGEVDQLAVAQHEPRLALDGGPDGLVLIERLLAQSPRVLAEGGLILLEIGHGQGEAVSALAAQSFPGAVVRVSPDYAGHERVVWIEPVGGSVESAAEAAANAVADAVVDANE